MLESFIVALDGNNENTGTLDKLRQLFALSCIEQDRGWFLESGYIDPPKAKAIRDMIEELCEDLTNSAVPLVDAFGVPDAIVKAPIGLRNPHGKIVA
jgi:acyl-CoA oxidase